MMRLSVLLLLSGTEVGRLVVQHLLLLLCVQAATAADSVNTTNRVRKASPARLHHIQQLIEHEAERQQTLLQDDAVLMDDLPALPPSAERNANELTANRHHFDDFFQGDVDLTDQQVDAIELTLNASSSSPSTTITTAAASVNENDALATRRAKRKIGAEPFYRRWPKRKPITFDFASSIPQSTRAKIRSAMLLWQYRTCVRFEEGGSSVDRIEFFDGGGCSSFVGRVGGVQGISIATPGCDDVGIISHEIGHALGVFHEQARVDQPENIRVNYQNVPLSKWNNFQPVAAHQINDFALPYDTGSVMHYGAYGFAADPYVPTIRTVDKGQQQTIGQRVGPSFLDVQAINLAYKCQELCDSHVPPVDCQYGGYPHPNDCTRCLCPDGLKGRTCNLAEQTDTCGGELELSDQIGELQLTSPNHRGHFKAGTVCSWIVKAPIGQRIVLDLDPDVDFDCGDVCDHSFLEIKHRADFRLTGSRICCSPPPQRRFVSERETMLIRLVGMRHSRRGFSAMLSLQSWTHSQRRETTRKARRRFTTTTTAAASTTTPETTTEDRDAEETTVSWSTLPAPETIPTNEDCTQCTGWAAWSTQCSQDCGGCGHRSRQRRCSGDQTKQCQETEKRMCNEDACPTGTNFLLNNHEFHILWNGCCVGLFRAGNQCSALQNGQKSLLGMIASFFAAKDDTRHR